MIKKILMHLGKNQSKARYWWTGVVCSKYSWVSLQFSLSFKLGNSICGTETDTKLNKIEPSFFLKTGNLIINLALSPFYKHTMPGRLSSQYDKI